MVIQKKSNGPQFPAAFEWAEGAKNFWAFFYSCFSGRFFFDFFNIGSLNGKSTELNEELVKGRLVFATSKKCVEEARAQNL